MPTTPRSKLPYPAASDTADVPRDLQALAVALDEIAYAEQTADVTTTTTVQASAVTVVTAPAVTFDGTTVVMVEFQANRFDVFAGSIVGVLDLWDGSTDLGILGSVRGLSTDSGVPFNRARRLTPSAGAHTYSIRGWLTGAGTAVMRATGALPAFMRITRV